MDVKKIGFLRKEEPGAQRLQKLRACVLQEEKGVRVILGIRTKQDIELAEGVLRLKKEVPCILLECVLPYETVANDWDEESRNRFFYVMEHCGQETMLQTKFTADAMEKLEAYLCLQTDIQV